jgi:hypothetical protein
MTDHRSTVPGMRLKWGLGIAAGLVFVVLCAVVATDLATGRTVTSANAGPAPSGTRALIQVPPITFPSSRGPVVLPVHPKTLLSVDGTGAGRTQTFTTGSDWYLRYSYDCPEGVPEGKVTTLEIFEYSGADQGRPIANESELDGTDVLPEHGPPGPRYLRISSLCDWTVTILG